jgi:hypothetical protein
MAVKNCQKNANSSGSVEKAAIKHNVGKNLFTLSAGLVDSTARFGRMQHATGTTVFR